MGENDAISRSALLEVGNVRQVTEYDEAGYYMTYNAVPINVIEALPALDVAPVVHARWVDKECEFVECSSCGEEYLNEYGMIETTRYCPNCGARMDGEADG